MAVHSLNRDGFGRPEELAEIIITEFYLPNREAARHDRTLRMGAPYFFSTNAYMRKTHWGSLIERKCGAYAARKQRKIMFRESEEFYHNLIAQVKDYAIFTTDPRGVITTWNEGDRKSVV